MQALKCDRCGKFYEKYAPMNCSGDIEKVLYYSIRRETIPDVYSRRLDLCEDCQRQLIIWIDGYDSIHREEK